MSERTESKNESTMKIEELRGKAASIVGRSVLTRSENTFDFVTVFQSLAIIVAVFLYLYYEFDSQLKSFDSGTGIISVENSGIIGVDEKEKKGKENNFDRLLEVAENKKVRVKNVNNYYVEIDMRYALILIAISAFGLLLSIVGMVLIVVMLMKEGKGKRSDQKKEHDRSHVNALAEVARKLDNVLGKLLSRQDARSRAEVVAEGLVLRYPRSEKEVEESVFVLDEGKQGSAKLIPKRAENEKVAESRVSYQ